MSLKGTPTWRFHTKLYKFRQIVFPNISHLKYCTDLIFGKTFCIFIFFHFPDSRRSVLNGLHFYFSLHDSANQELLSGLSIVYRILRSISGEAMTVLETGLSPSSILSQSLALEDFYRVCNPRGKIFTWFNGPQVVGVPAL